MIPTLKKHKTGSLEDLVEIKRMLATLLFEALPISYVRQKEWSVNDDLVVSVTACLRCPLPANIAAPLLAKTKLPKDISEQFLAMISLPCWRHILRNDQEGGISLYIERDWDYKLLTAICSWFGVSNQPVGILNELREMCGCEIAGIGIHWCRFGNTRLRLYTVSRGQMLTSKEYKKEFLTLLAKQFRCSIPPWINKLIDMPRRALLVNVEEKNGIPALKIEIPDVEWSEIADVALLRSYNATVFLNSNPPARLRYLGVRLLGNAELNATFYMPYSYPNRGTKHSCGLLM